MINAVQFYGVEDTLFVTEIKELLNMETKLSFLSTLSESYLHICPYIKLYVWSDVFI